VFPHEVVGFSGGTKYFCPGIAGQDIIDFTHWLGALLTSREIIGSATRRCVRSSIAQRRWSIAPSRASASS
jgi:lactate racemase